MSDARTHNTEPHALDGGFRFTTVSRDLVILFRNGRGGRVAAAGQGEGWKRCGPYG